MLTQKEDFEQWSTGEWDGTEPLIGPTLSAERIDEALVFVSDEAFEESLKQLPPTVEKRASK